MCSVRLECGENPTFVSGNSTVSRNTCEIFWLSCIRAACFQRNRRFCLFYRACFQVCARQTLRSVKLTYSKHMQRWHEVDRRWYQAASVWTSALFTARRSASGNVPQPVIRGHCGIKALWHSCSFEVFLLSTVANPPSKLYVIISSTPSCHAVRWLNLSSWSGFNFLIWVNLGIFSYSKLTMQFLRVFVQISHSCLPFAPSACWERLQNFPPNGRECG